jgi:hypothetical protein
MTQICKDFSSSLPRAIEGVVFKLYSYRSSTAKVSFDIVTPLLQFVSGSHSTSALVNPTNFSLSIQPSFASVTTDQGCRHGLQLALVPTKHTFKQGLQCRVENDKLCSPPCVGVTVPNCSSPKRSGLSGASRQV